MALRFDDKNEEALRVFEPILDDDPSPFNEASARVNIAVALDALGRNDEARETVERLVEVFPAWTLTYQSTLLRAFRDQKLAEAQIDTLRRLGMPQ